MTHAASPVADPRPLAVARDSIGPGRASAGRCLAAGWCVACLAAAAGAAVVELPQSRPSRRVLRDYLAMLVEADFVHGVERRLTPPDLAASPDDAYRIFILDRMAQPLVGGELGAPSVNAPARLFTLACIEGPATAPDPQAALAGFEPAAGPPTIRPGPVPTPTGIVRPPCWPEAVAAFVRFGTPATNPFHGNPALKRRAMVTAIVDLVMLGDLVERDASLQRADLNAYWLAALGATCSECHDVLPPGARAAFVEELALLGRRILGFGPRFEDPAHDMSIPVGLWYAARAVGDEAFSREVEAFTRSLLDDRRLLDATGCWVVPGGGVDVGQAGMANWFLVWLGLATDWPFVREKIDLVYRLRAHLILPEPDGTSNGPSEFNRVVGVPASYDRWHWYGSRDHGAALVSDEALCAIWVPTRERLAESVADRVEFLNRQLFGEWRNPINPFGARYGKVRDEDIRGTTWAWQQWHEFNPVAFSPGHDFYRPGGWSRLHRLQEAGSPLLRSPFLREENFVRRFGDRFVVAKQAGYAAILHTGSLGAAAGSAATESCVYDPGTGRLVSRQAAGVAESVTGFGGGQLSGFWTPATGPVLLGRRSGRCADGTCDDLANWRLWPVHAVSGVTAAGGVFSSAGIAAPTVTAVGNGRTVTVEAAVPTAMFGRNAVLRAGGRYRRVFRLEEAGLRVETSLELAPDEDIAELHESLPVFLGDAPLPALYGRREVPPAEEPTIEFRVDERWLEASVAGHGAVSAVRITRGGGAVEIRFDEPRPVRLAAEAWQDEWITKARCRNVLIDRREAAGASGAIRGERTIAYTVAPAGRP